MRYELCQERGFTIAGITGRASNAVPERIGDLWRRFHAMGGAQAIPGRQDDTVYCVYCEYEGDFNAPYTVVIGCSVDSDAPVGDGFAKIGIEAGRFAVLRAEGELPQGIFAAWRQVWESPLDRRYQADYDRYGVDDAATVHVGVR